MDNYLWTLVPFAFFFVVGMVVEAKIGFAARLFRKAGDTK